MAIHSCDHGEFIVCFDVSKGNTKCPVCDMDENTRDLERQVAAADIEIDDLKDELKSVSI